MPEQDRHQDHLGGEGKAHHDRDEIARAFKLQRGDATETDIRTGEQGDEPCQSENSADDEFLERPCMLVP